MGRLLGLVHRREAVEDARQRVERARELRADATEQGEWARETYRRNGIAELFDLSFRPRPSPPDQQQQRRGPKHP